MTRLWFVPDIFCCLADENVQLCFAIMGPRIQKRSVIVRNVCVIHGASECSELFTICTAVRSSCHCGCHWDAKKYLGTYKLIRPGHNISCFGKSQIPAEPQPMFVGMSGIVHVSKASSLRGGQISRRAGSRQSTGRVSLYNHLYGVLRTN